MISRFISSIFIGLTLTLSVSLASDLNLNMGFELPSAKRNYLIIKSRNGVINGRIDYRDNRFGRKIYTLKGHLSRSKQTPSGIIKYKFHVSSEDGTIVRGTVWTETRWTDTYSAQKVNFLVGRTSNPRLFHQKSHRLQLKAIAAIIII
jgi:hypothetical protein